MKEKLRKFLVSLKRKPHMIPLVVLGIAFIIYSLRLTVISNTTARIQGPNMGLCGFVTMLFSMLGMVSFGRSFPHRKPVNKVMLCLTFLLMAAVIFADTQYIAAVTNAITREVDPIEVTASTSYITESVSMLKLHIGVVIAGLALTALLPVYSPLIKKINTNIAVAENKDMGAIDLAGDA
ncbi:MAG: hypothetical protein IKE24_03820 [Clostridia bacterium]|nr:hypothetical protein [Clostridia bacterium]